jgi:hypothetical protein
MKQHLALPALLFLAACGGNDFINPDAPAARKPSLNVIGSPPVWKRFDISPIPGNSTAWKINDRSDVAGWSNTRRGTRGWVRSASGTVNWLLSAPGAIGSEAFAISNSGVVAGTMLYAGSIQRAALWPNPTAAPFVLDSLPSVNTNAFGVSDLGDVTGWGLDPAGGQVAFVWRPLINSLAMTRLQNLGINEAQAYDITNNWVVGAANDGIHGMVAVRWRIKGGAPQTLSAPGLGGWGTAYGITPNGAKIVGFDDVSPGRFLPAAAMWTPPGGESIYGPTPFWWSQELRDQNDLGVAVGVADTTGLGGIATPWVIRDDPTLGYATTLPIPAGQSGEAFSINASCEIVGWGSGSAWVWVPSRCP